jgi:ADP-heptose:LPS heptosyltransferase
VIRPGALGDVLVTLPALQRYRRGYPAASIELLGNPAVIRWLPGRSVVSSVESFDRVDLARLFLPDGLTEATLIQYLDSFDHILNYAVPGGHPLARNLERVCRARVYHLDTRSVAMITQHISDYLQHPLEALGLTPTTGWPELEPRPRDRQAALEWQHARGIGGRPVVAIHPGSGSPAKNWPAERFAMVAQRLVQDRGVDVMLISGPADDDTIRAVVGKTGDNRTTHLHQPDLGMLAAMLATCAAYLGNDSGVTHLAAAAGTETLALFGPTDPRIWAPRGSHVTVLSGCASCAPCLPEERRFCRMRHCLDDLSVDQVVLALYGALNAALARRG